MKPKAVLAYCREKGIRAFDLRYVDLMGQWRHVSFPVSSLTENVFEDGIGQEVALMPRSAEPLYAVLIPDSEANYLDPFTEHPTLVLAASAQDVVHRQESDLDSRFILSQALRYLQSTGIADEVLVRTALRYEAASLEPAQGGGGCDGALPEMDHQFLTRGQIVNFALDAGLNVDRHLIAPCGSSEIALRSSPVFEAADDAMMLKYLIANCLSQGSRPPGGGNFFRETGLGETGRLQGAWASCQWSFIRNSEPVFTDDTYHGISELGLHAQGGLIKHSVVLSGIYLLAICDPRSVTYPFANSSATQNARSICREVRSPNAPRETVIEINAIPSLANYHLAYAATIMAMMDGVQNKYLPQQLLDGTTVNGLADELHVWKREHAAETLDSDWEFLNRGEVFGENVLHWIREKVRGAR